MQICRIVFFFPLCQSVWLQKLSHSVTVCLSLCYIWVVAVFWFYNTYSPAQISQAAVLSTFIIQDAKVCKQNRKGTRGGWSICVILRHSRVALWNIDFQSRFWIHHLTHGSFAPLLEVQVPDSVVALVVLLWEIKGERFGKDEIR